MDAVSHILIVKRTVVQPRPQHEQVHGAMNMAYQVVEVCKHKRVSYKHAVVLYCDYCDIGACSQRDASWRHSTLLGGTAYWDAGTGAVKLVGL